MEAYICTIIWEVQSIILFLLLKISLFQISYCLPSMSRVYLLIISSTYIIDQCYARITLNML